jgi:hypothetical protein
VKKHLTLSLLALTLSIALFSQDYRQAIGVRLGASSGFTYRKILASDLAAELMLNSQNHGSVLTFLVEKHKPATLFDDINLDFFYGAGIHVGLADRYYNDDDYINKEDIHSPHLTLPQLGLDAYFSFEYTMPKYPVVLNIDCKPYLEFFDNHYLGMHLPVIAIGAKYIF